MLSFVTSSIRRLFRTPLYTVATGAFLSLAVLGAFGTVARLSGRPGMLFGVSQYSRVLSYLSGILIFLGAGLLYRALEVLLNKRRLQRSEAPAFSAIFILILTILFFRGFLQDDAAKIGEATERQVKWVAAQVRQVLDGHVLSAERMAARWNYRGGITEGEWMDDALHQFTDLPGVAVVTWIDRTGFFRWVYPPHKLASIAKISHLEDPDRREVFVSARDKKTTTFTSLMNFVSGGRGFAVLIPVYKKNEFDGMVSMAIEVGPFLERTLYTRGFRIQFSEGEKVFFDTAGKTPTNFAQDQDLWSKSIAFQYRSLQWKIQSTPFASEVLNRSNPLSLLVLWSGLFAALLLSLIVRLYLLATFAKEQAWEAVEWQAAILNGSDLGVVSTGLDGKVRYLNPAAEKMIGYSKEEMVAKETLFLWLDSEEVRAYTDALSLELGRSVTPGIEAFLAKPNSVHKHEWKIHRKDGERRTLVISVHSLRSSAGKLTGLVGILDDVTERRSQQKKLIDQQALMVHSARLASLGEMAAGIAHEINNPLLVISGKVQQIRRSYELGKGDPAQMLGHADAIKKTVERIAKIISGLRSFARDSSADPYSATSVTRLVNETISFCIERFHNQAVDLRVVLPEEDFDMECRAYQISQVLLNLLNNAFDAAFERQDGDRWVEISVRKLSPWQVEFSVRDSGPGVPFALRSKIMLPFFTTKEVGKGTGLGLSISKGIAQDHGGEIVLDTSAPETCFRVIIPLLQS